MALATKCPHCNTIFRVAHDQLKLRGGIVRCGACNEVFDGSAALVEAALKQPVIIDMPAAPTPAPTSSPELEALITTLDARAAEAERHDAALEREQEQERALAPEPEVAPELAPEPEHELAPEPEPDHAPEPELAPELAPEPEPEPEQEAGSAPGPARDDEAFDLDLDVDIDDEPQPAPPAISTLDDEPPDEHLTAVALHDSFELDAYPARSDVHEDEDIVTLSGGASPVRDVHADRGTDQETDAEAEPGPESDTNLEANVLLDAGDNAGDNAGVSTAANGPATPISTGLASANAADAADDEPGFVKRDRRRQQVGKAARVAMALGIPLLLAALAAQVLGTFRNPLAAAVPALKPALESACALVGCKVDLPAQIDALSIEQGELQTLADNVFSFTTTLRNGSRSAQAWPHIELILNDDAGKPVLRRVFAPREYLANPANPADVAKGFAPRSEQSVKLYFELAQIKASGYHIAVFYP